MVTKPNFWSDTPPRVRRTQPHAPSFIGGFRTTVPVQAAASRSAVIRNPQHEQTCRLSNVETPLDDARANRYPLAPASGDGKGLPKNRLASSLLLAQHLCKRANRAIL